MNEKCPRCGTKIHDGTYPRPVIDPDSGERYHADCWEQERHR